MGKRKHSETEDKASKFTSIVSANVSERTESPVLGIYIYISLVDLWDDLTSSFVFCI